MCGRFSITATPEDVEDLFALDEVDPFPPRYNIAPTQPILMVRQTARAEPGSNRARREALLVRWGLIPSWVKDVKSFPLLINARSETVMEKSSFRAAIRHRRTLVPASGFYEWKRSGEKKSYPYWVFPRHGGLVAFAGLMETYLAPDGSEIDTGAILTAQSNREFMPIHDRMPVIIQPEHFDRWLNTAEFEPRQVADLLTAAEPGFFDAIPVSEKVNKVANTGPEIQERINLNDPVDLDETKPAEKPVSKPQLKLF
ncbi:MAG: SOS response-associated peptidase [Rhizobiaceae bacterium]